MTVINFPDSPSDGDTQDVGGITYTYSSSKGYWTAAASGGAGGGGASVTTDDAAPSNPSDGDLWWDSDGGKMYVYYDDGSSSQWVSVSVPGATGSTGPAGPTGPAGASASNSYANLAAFPATPAEGDIAYAQDTDALYVYKGTAWSRIDSGDESPIILTEPATTHTLNSNGSTSTVTMVAEDPEGFDITYGIAYKTANNARPAQLASDPSINQSTGVYTFTPTTNTSNEGSFKARLSASDGANTTTRFVDFSLSFYDSLDALNDGSCIALYKLNGNGDDVSGNYNSTGYIAGSSSGFDNSIYKYDGSLNSTSTTLDLPNVRTSYPISVSAWIRPSNVSTTAFTEVLNMLMGSSQRLSLGVHSYNSVFSPIIAYGGTNHWYFTPNTAFVNDTWYHIIFSIVGSNDSSHGVYINGSASVTPTNTGGAHGGSAGWALGGNAAGGEHFLGHIDHVRIFNKALSATEAATLYNKGG